MKKVQTNSPTTFIMESLDKKFVRQYKRKTKGLYAYPRTVPIDKVLKLLDGSDVKHPKLLKNRFRCVDIEYIKGETLMVEPNLTGLITLISNYIFGMSNIKCDPIMKYIKWTNTKEYYDFLVDNFIKSVDSYHNEIKVNSIGLTKDMLLKLKDKQIDETRKLRLIHGEIIPDNIICSADGYYLIDWELATYGDIAYELATHLIAVEYTPNSRNDLINRVALSLGEDSQSLALDIDTYMDFEYVRRCFSIMNKVIELMRKGKPFESVLDDGFKYYTMFFKDANKEEIINKLKTS